MLAELKTWELTGLFECTEPCKNHTILFCNPYCTSLIPPLCIFQPSVHLPWRACLTHQPSYATSSSLYLKTASSVFISTFCLLRNPSDSKYFGKEILRSVLRLLPRSASQLLSKYIQCRILEEQWPMLFFSAPPDALYPYIFIYL